MVNVFSFLPHAKYYTSKHCYNKIVIINITKSQKFNVKFKEATTPWQKTKGLIGSHKTGIIFTTRLGIHTFLLKLPIDVYVLNNQNRVVKIKKNLKPNRIWLWNPIYKTILEIPSGKIKNGDIGIGNELEVIL